VSVVFASNVTEQQPVAIVMSAIIINAFNVPHHQKLIVLALPHCARTMFVFNVPKVMSALLLKLVTL